jgi:hypothetical protein
VSFSPKMRIITHLRSTRGLIREGSLTRRILVSAALSLVFGVGERSPIVNRIQSLWTPVALPRVATHLIPAPPDVLAFACLRQPRPYPVALRQRDLSSMGNAGPHEMAFALTGGGTPELVVGASVAPRDFSRLGVRPLLGRTLRVSDNCSRATPVVMIGEMLWRTRFSADAAIVGKSILLSAHAYRVVGILPATFRFPYASDPVEIWLPAAQDPQLRESQAQQAAAEVKELTTAAQPSPSPSSSPARKTSPVPAPASRSVAPVATIAPLAPLAPLAPVTTLTPAARVAPAKVTVTSQD